MNRPILSPSPSVTKKQRHGCLTAFLSLAIITNSIMCIVYLVGFLSERNNLHYMPKWAIPALIITGIINLICAIALLKWKKWGFWGFVINAIIIVAINITIGINPVRALIGLVGVIILYGVLQMGNGQNGWSQLE